MKWSRRGEAAEAVKIEVQLQLAIPVMECIRISLFAEYLRKFC